MYDQHNKGILLNTLMQPQLGSLELTEILSLDPLGFNFNYSIVEFWLIGTS